jgi:outer membrane lipoprotein-sorting protein
VKVVERDVDGEDARQSGRYTMKEFGLKIAVQKTYRDWKAAKDKGMFRVQYLGIRKVREAGNRLCYTLRRTCTVPEEEGVTEVTIYIDKENWLQVGSILKGEDGKLIGEYMFRDLRINPEFKPNQFKRSALTS